METTRLIMWPKSPQIIGFDLDDVIFATNEAIAPWHNRVYGTSYGFEDINTWDLWKIWGCSKEEFLHRVHEFYESPEHEMIRLIDGAYETLKILHGCDRELHAVTSRPEEFRKLTMNLVDQHVPFLSESVHFVGLNGHGGKTKSEVCRKLGVQIFVEDAPVHAHDIVESNIPVIVHSRPWNKAIGEPEGMRRRDNMYEIFHELY